MAPGYGVEDGAALHFVGTELEEVVCSRPAARAAYVSTDPRGRVVERELPARFLGAPAGERGLSDGAALAA
jgi:hypothetical protein